MSNSSPVHTTQNSLQRRRNSSLLMLNIPSRGYFVKDLILRATNDLDKVGINQKTQKCLLIRMSFNIFLFFLLLQSNVCQEQPHEGNTILQYNFRILRNCD